MVMNSSGSSIFLSLYLNNTQIGQVSDVGSLASEPNNDFSIGGFQNIVGSALIGGINCVSLFNRSLTNEEITIIYDNANEGRCLQSGDIFPPNVTITSPLNQTRNNNCVPVSLSLKRV